MSFDIPNEQKISILQSRLESLKLDGYQYEINKKTAEALENTNAALQASEAIENIMAAIQVVQSELDKLI